ncbi:hypothetical protein K438DRAFT_1953636 [Mycena galopus ATCC 62051]|nr:hypothetical protein K438DRAFT_1953636 [Mycena galopus ATCC 62051]
MSSESPPAKRQRTENVLSTRSARWFSDGSVVLQAANTQFRVHWGVLALHSTVFRDMQGLPQPPDQPNIEGCPVVEISDSPEDVENLLQALYTPTFLAQDKLPLPVIGALIRLGRKYDFQDLFNSAVKRLTSDCPTTFEDFDALPNAFKPRTIEQAYDIRFDIVILANGNNILSVLPCAYYFVVAEHTLNDLFNGIEKENGMMASLPLVDVCCSP